MTVRIVDFSDEYLDDVWAIEQKAHAHPWQMMSVFGWQSPMQCHRVLLLDGNVAGYYYAQNAVGDISLLNIAIDPVFQGQGLGAQLLQSLIDYAHQARAENIFLEVRQSNSAAIHLYRKLGFVEQGTRMDYYPTHKGREAAVLMAYVLLPEDYDG